MIRKLLDRKVMLSNIGLVTMLVLGALYLTVGIAGFNPLKPTYDLVVNMDRSGGLQPRNDVLYRGLRVGKIDKIELTANGIAAHAEIEKKYKIPMNGTVAVQALSAAGEQYIDFRPASDEGPFYEDGSHVPMNVVQTPAPISQVLTNASDLLNSINPDNIDMVLNELEVATQGGPDQLRRLAGSLSQTVAGMDSVLPQLVSLIESIRVIAETTSHAQPDLGTLVSNGGVLFDATQAADDELRTLLETAPGNFASLSGSVADLSDPITGIAQKLKVIGDSAVLREQALGALFPTLAQGIAAAQFPFHHNAFNLLLEPYTRPFCEYDTPVGDPAKIPDPRVRKWQYCETNHNEIQVRGAANAPRPEGGINTAGPPEGYDPNELTPDLSGN